MENGLIREFGTKTIPAELMKSYRDVLNRGLDFVGKSKQLKDIRSEISRYSAGRGEITIVGPNGAGRKTLARAIHFESSDWWRPFVEADLAGMDEDVASRLLFGHKEGHIFSPDEVTPGLVNKAQQSMLCFKNFDTYSKGVQDAICRLHRSRKYHPFSGGEAVSLDCRIIFTIRNEPADLKKAGYISDDVFTMLSENVVVLPPLSKRKDDVLPLVEKFIRDCCIEFGLPFRKLSKDAEKYLKKAPWNSNVTQLKKAVYFACVNTADAVLSPAHFALAHDGNIEAFQEKQLGELSLQELIEAKLEVFLGKLGKFEATNLYEAIIGRVEEPLLRLVMNYAKGNQIKASRILGINRNTLRSMLARHDIKIARGRGRNV